MKFLQKKSKWDRLTEPLSAGGPAQIAKTGARAVGTFIALSLASAAVSAVRARTSKEEE
jgi:hypothetical protein